MFRFVLILLMSLAVSSQAIALDFSKYDDEKICKIAKTNGFWNKQYEDERIWVDEAKRRGLSCVDETVWQLHASKSSDEKVCSLATTPKGESREWLFSLKPDEAIYKIFFKEAQDRNLSCDVPHEKLHQLTKKFISEEEIISNNKVVSGNWGGTNYSEKSEYLLFRGLPCKFNGALTKSVNNAATLGPKSQNCCPKCKGYSTKIGQTIHAKKGTPVVAIADMKLSLAKNRSAEQRTGRWEGKDVSGQVSKPYDDLSLTFNDNFGNKIVYYHLESRNPFVPGFDKGKCKIPIEWQTEKWKREPGNCGGYKKFEVKKGEVIGYVGTTGGNKNKSTGLVNGEHISIGIYVEGKDPRFGNKRGLVVPSHNFIWENHPTDDPFKYLLPIQ